MGTFEDLTGRRYGRIVVVKRIGSRSRGIKKQIKTPLWLCKCDCGRETQATSAELRTGDKRSCGCLAREILTARNMTHGDAHSGSLYFRLYHLWFGMLDRCENPHSDSYKDYGGRGISVCEEWHDYPSFKMWAISNGYKNGLTIDRVNNDAGYSPDNCRWTNYTEQANNRRSCRYVTINGKTKTITEWCRIYGTNEYTAYSRIDRFGWNPVDAVTLPPAKKNFYKKRA